MIAFNHVGWQSHSWQWQLRHAITDINDLVSLLGLPESTVANPFPLRVPLPFVARMRKGDPGDPLLRQVLPVAAEDAEAPGYTLDPLHESGFSATAGLLHKYHGRVLAIVTGVCAVNCRYCFRRHFPYEEFQPDLAQWEKIFDYVGADPSISEVILSGGDPLVLSDTRLAGIEQRLAAIPHLTTLRFHTRLPVVIPQRICDALTTWMGASRLKIVVVVHTNHANEIDGDTGEAMARLRAVGVTLLNQSVLLRGVNDSADALANLSLRLFDVGVLPYYLHALDPVAGAAHFAVPDSKMSGLMVDLAARLPGYLVPRLVREIPGASAKTPYPLRTP